MLGRIPINGTVTDPYPFKVLIGKDNLTANGIELPDVEGAIVSGSASGDWTLSCVRGQVNSITFVFADGTVRTVPQPVTAIRRIKPVQTAVLAGFRIMTVFPVSAVPASLTRQRICRLFLRSPLPAPPGKHSVRGSTPRRTMLTGFHPRGQAVPAKRRWGKPSLVA